MASVINDVGVISPYRKLLLQLSDQLKTEDIDKLKLLCVDLIPRWKAENVKSGLEFFDLLEQDARISEGNVTLLVELFNTVRRMDMVSCIEAYLQKDVACVADGENPLQLCGYDGVGQQGAHVTNSEPKESVATKPGKALDVVDADEVADEVTDGGKEQPRFAAFRRPTGAVWCMSSSPADNLSGQEEIPGYPDAGSDKEKEDQEEAGPSTRVKPVNPSCATPDQPFPAPSPSRYVDFLGYRGYAVKIIGGKHFKTPEGEFVEMKSGAHYKIHATNTHVEGCHVDISIDGYDVGGWVLDGHEELTIERPANEPKKFTFYRVKTAPKEAGIEPGRSENGVVRCVFTPEANITVSVDVPSFHQSLQIEVPPRETVGYLKRELQLQLNTADDPDQVIVLKNKKLVNGSLVRHHLQPLLSENLRLLAAQLEISVEMSSGETFPVTVHPGKSKICDVMQLIENVTHVPSADQKLYRGRSRLSDLPKRHLPDELICNPNPKLVVIIPEYLHLNVKSQDGKICTIKIDPEKTLRDLLKQIPCCQSLAGNQEVELLFEGRCLDPYSDRSLQVCNIKTGSTIEVRVKTTCVVRVRLPDNSRTVAIMINPEETFKDLVERLKKANRGIELENVTLAMGDRIFDPERDKAPLKDYEIAHGSFLAAVHSERAKASTMLGEDEVTYEDEGTDVELYAHASVGKPVQTGSGVHVSVSGYAEMSESDEGTDEESCGFKGLTDKVVDTGQEMYAQGLPMTQKDPAWKAGGTTLQGHSMQLFTPAESLKVDPSRKVELLLRLVAREDEEVGAFPKDECKPLSTLYPSPVPD